MLEALYLLITHLHLPYKNMSEDNQNMVARQRRAAWVDYFRYFTCCSFLNIINIIHKTEAFPQLRSKVSLTC